MLNQFSVALSMDVRTVDGAGDAITLDRSCHGLHPYLSGDGATVARMPTLDPLNGKYDFDGGDLMARLDADDVADVMDGMGSAQAESYVFLFDPFIQAVDATQVILFKGDIAGNFVRIRQTNTNLFEFRVTELGVGNEIITTANTYPPLYNGKRLLLTCIRDTDRQEIWTDDALAAADTDTTVDGGGDGPMVIGSASVAGSTFLAAGNALRFVGYVPLALVQTQLRALKRYFEGLL